MHGTKRYQNSLLQDDERNYSFFEFTQGYDGLGPRMMIPVVMEPSMLNNREWEGPLAGLRGHLFSGFHNDDISNCDDLYTTIMNINSGLYTSYAIKSDVFVSFNWGRDELCRDNHQRVNSIISILRYESFN
jgi:hypothetical protein